MSLEQGFNVSCLVLVPQYMSLTGTFGINAPPFGSRIRGLFVWTSKSGTDRQRERETGGVRLEYQAKSMMPRRRSDWRSDGDGRRSAYLLLHQTLTRNRSSSAMIIVRRMIICGLFLPETANHCLPLLLLTCESGGRAQTVAASGLLYNPMVHSLTSHVIDIFFFCNKSPTSFSFYK